MALDFSDTAISKALEDVRNGTNGVNWALFSFVPKSLTKIRVDGTGSDGLSECAEDFSEGKVQYAYLRYSIKNTNKFVYIAWLGGSVTGMLKGSFNNTVVDMANFIKKGNPIHVQINARSEIDLDEEKIKEKLVKAVGSNYDAGAVKQGVSEGIKNVTQGKKLHQEEISKASQTNAVGDTKLEFNKEASAKFWQQDRTQPTPPGKPQQSKAQIDEDARKKYWEEQKKREEEEKRAAQAKAQQPRGPVGGAGSVKGRFESAQKAQTQAPPPKPVANTPKKVSTAAFTAPASSAPPKVNNTPKPISQVAPPAPKPVNVAPPKPVEVAKPPPPKPTPPVVKKPEPVPEPEPTYQEEYAQEEYGEEYAQEEYGQEEYAQEEYAQEEYAQEEYGQEEYAQEEVTHGQEEYAQEEHGQEEYAQEEYAQEEYAQEEYGQEEYAQEEYAQEEYQEEGSGGQRVVALYDYEAAQDGDLSFKAGENITVVDTSDPGGWWRGQTDDGREGVFPSNFVQ